MSKVHTRTKRRWGLPSRFSYKKTLGGAPRGKGAKTFSTKEAADTYAKKHKIVKYELISVKKNKRFAIKQ